MEPKIFLFSQVCGLHECVQLSSASIHLDWGHSKGKCLNYYVCEMLCVTCIHTLQTYAPAVLLRCRGFGPTWHRPIPTSYGLNIIIWIETLGLCKYFYISHASTNHGKVSRLHLMQYILSSGQCPQCYRLSKKPHIVENRFFLCFTHLFLFFFERMFTPLPPTPHPIVPPLPTPPKVFKSRQTYTTKQSAMLPNVSKFRIESEFWIKSKFRIQSEFIPMH